MLDLNQIHLATGEDKAFGIDCWAKLFKAKTWEELKMLAQKNDTFEETCETIFKLNQDDVARYWCEAREEGLRVYQTYVNMYENEKQKNAEQASVIEEQAATIARLQAQLKSYQQQ